MRRGWLLSLLFLSLLAPGCKHPADTFSWSVIHADSVNSKFRMAEELLRQEQYAAAALRYKTLQNSPLSPIENEYASLNEILCGFQSDSVSDRSVPKLINSKLSGLHHLVTALRQVHLNQSGISELQLAKKEMKQNHQSKTLHYLFVLTNVAACYRSTDVQIDSAVANYQEAARLTQQEPKLVLFKPDIFYSLAELSLVHRDIYTGLSYLQQASSGSLSSLMQGKIAMLRGTLYRKIPQYDSADTYFAFALNIFTHASQPRYLSLLLREMAVKSIVLNDQKEFSTTLSRLERIDSLHRDPQVNIDRLYGYYYYNQNEKLKSITHYENAVKTLRSHKKPDVVQISEGYYLLTEQYRALGKFDLAEATCYEDMVYSTAFKDAPLTWKNILRSAAIEGNNNFFDYIALAEINLDHYDREPNERYLTRALNLCRLTDSLISRQIRVTEEEAVLNYLNIGHRAYSAGIRASYLLYKLRKDTAHLNFAHQCMEKSKALIVYRDMIARQAEYFPEVPADFKNREFEIKEKIARLKKNGDNLADAELTESINELSAFFLKMKEKYPAYYRSKYETQVKSFTFFQTLSKEDGRSFIQYHRGKDFLYGLTYDAIPRFERMPADSSFEMRLTNFIASVNHPPDINKKDNFQNFANESFFFYQKLIEPLHPAMAKQIIVPDGILARLPFDLLVTNLSGNFQTAPYLIKTISFSYAYSLKGLAIGQKVKEHFSSGKILAYAYSDPDEVGKPNKILAELPGSFKEINSIEQIFTESDITSKSGLRATRENFLDDVKKPFDIIHLALHASSSNTSKLDNKIFFRNGDANPQPLYGYELATHKLPASLIVLTGCETSNGPWVVGEGTYSLARAFKQCGSKNIIASLWPVADQHSFQIVDVFYKNLKEGKSIPESLRDSKIRYLSNADPLTSHPYFWSALAAF